MYLLLQDQELIEITFKKTVLDNPIFLKFAFCKRFCYLMGYFPVVLQNLMDSPFIINFKPHRNNHLEIVVIQFPGNLTFSFRLNC